MRPRILIVDDSGDFVEYSRRRLAARGLTVLTAADGEAALGIYDRETVDVVLLDILMPGMDGIETLRELKKRDPHVQVVMLTGHGTPETLSQGENLGATELLLKPAELDTVLAAIDRAVERRGARGADAAARTGLEATKDDGT
jgi:DNA-binding NtrC family response regulator